MTSVQQTGQITPFHLATWSANGVIGDGGAPPASETVLASLRGANFNTINDQPIVIPQQFVAFSLTRILVTNATLSLTTAAGGFYPAASKGGTPIVSAGQAYSALTTAGGLLSVTLASFGSNTRFSSANLAQLNSLLTIYFSLTTAQGAAAQADVYLVGINLT